MSLSIRRTGRIRTLLGLSLVSVLLSVALGGYWFNQIIYEVGTHAKQRAALMIDVEEVLGNAGIELGSPIQEWKDSLLRIHDPVLYTRHRQDILLHHAAVQREVLHEIRALGIHLALDDFGTGYSSLSYLRRFPINILKIDQSFVSDADNNPDDAEMVKTIIGMAHNLRMSVVAEGIETDAQRALLAVQGCQVGQGYHYSRPLPVDEFPRLLQHGIGYQSHIAPKNLTVAQEKGSA